MATIKIDQLSGDNYDTWKIHMRAILKKNDLWEYVSGAIPRPSEKDAKFAEWSRLDGKAESDILLAVSPSELVALDGLETSKAIWDKLQSLYQSKGPARKASLLKKLVLTRMQEEDDLRKHITDFFDAVKKLKEMGLVVFDELLAILLLYSLPDSFSMFRTAMESRDDLPNTESLKVKIVEDYEGRKSKLIDQGAMYVKRNQAGTLKKSNKEENKQKVECYRCGRYGHYAKDCRSKFIKKLFTEKKDTKQKQRSNYTAMHNTAEEAMLSDQNRSAVWCIDSGCTGHMCNQRDKLQSFVNVRSQLNLANAESTMITGKGKVSLQVDIGSEERRVDVDNVFYVGDLRTNLLSVAKMTNKGFEVNFRAKDAIVIDKNGKVHMRADRIGDLYYVRLSQNSVNNIETKSSIDIWHKRLGHLNERDLKLMAREGLVHGMSIKDSEKLSECEICLSEKQTCRPFQKGIKNRTSELLEIVHTDVCGPKKHPSFSGKMYFVTFIDDKSRWCEVYFIRNKSDVFEIFKTYKAEVENFTGKKIKSLQSDNGREYINREFDTYLKKTGIVRRLTVPYTPQQNGIAERKNRTLIEMTRCMMRQAGSPPAFWAEALFTANYIRNRCPTKALNGEIPFSLWKKKKPTVLYMQVFGSKVYYKEKGVKKGKFESSSEEGIFLGYDIQSKAYRIQNSKNHKIVVARDVKFMNESSFRHEYKEILDEEESRGHGQIMANLDKNPIENIEEEIRKPILTDQKETVEMGRPLNEEEEIRETVESKRNSTVKWERLVDPVKKGIGRLIRVDEENTSEETDEEYFSGILEPMTWREAEKRSEVDQWRAAMEDEFLAQIKNGTWEVVPKPCNRKVIGSKFVFTTKRTGENERKKVRLVAKGCSQRPGEDFHETYSPVVRSSSIRILSAISAEYGFDIHQMDVVTAYLNGKLDEKVYMNVPEQLSEVLDRILTNQKIGLSHEIVTDEKIIETAKRWRLGLDVCDDRVCLLKKSLYGLRQSGLQWHKELVSKVKGLGFKSLSQDQCLFVANKGESMMMIAMYVDDLILATNDDEWLKEVKKELSVAFEMKDMGKVSHCLGIQFARDNESRVYMNQRIYIEKLLDRFGMSDCKSIGTPMDVNVKLDKPECMNKDVMSQYPFQSLIGALMFLAVSTRPDIAFAVNYLSQFNTNYDVEHWKAAKRVLRYLKGTLDTGLVYEKTGLQLFGVVDSDWGSNVVDRKSYSGYAFILAGASISWEARKQRSTALSSTEAEYIGLSEATKEAVYLLGILNSMGYKCERVTLFNDNQGAIKLAQSRSYKSRTKHIDVRHHYVRDMYDDGLIDLRYLCTERMPADVLTKGLSGPKHHECMRNLGMM